jgi:hypothetical protein
MEIVKRSGLTPAIEEKKNAIQKRIVLEGLTPIALRVAKAGSERIIKTIPDREFDENGKNIGLVYKMGILANGIAKDYSIRSVDEAQVFRFYTTVRDYYSQFTLSEIRIAFELALVGELDSFLPKDQNGMPDKSAYQNFSQEFICKILNAYKNYRGKVWNKVFLLTSKEETVKSEEEKENDLNNFKTVLKEQFEEWKETGVLRIMFIGYTAKYLIDQGLVKDIEVNERHKNGAYQRLLSLDNRKDLEDIKTAYSANSENLKLDSMAERIKNEELIIKAFREIQKNESL